MLLLIPGEKGTHEMKFTRLLLSILGAAFVSQGVFYFFRPELVRRFLELQAQGSNGEVELAVMYGGLPVALGILCLIGALRPATTRVVLLSMWLIAIGAVVPRLVMGIALGDMSYYTLAGIVLESLAVVVIGGLLLRPD